MVFRKRWQVVVATTMNTDKRNFMRVNFLQLFAMFNGYEPVARAVKNISMAVHMPEPFICPQFVHQQKLYR